MEKQYVLKESEYTLIKHFLKRITEHNDTILQEFLAVYDGKKEAINEDLIYTLSTYIRDTADVANKRLEY